MCLAETIFFGILSSLVSVLLISIFFKLKIYMILHKLNGKNYKGFQLDGTPHQDDKNYEVNYELKNFIRLNNKLKITQNSQNYGNWVSEIYIHETKPFLASGIYKYEKNRPNAGTWGVQEIQINLVEKTIHIKATSKGRIGQNEFIIKQM